MALHAGLMGDSSCPLKTKVAPVASGDPVAVALRINTVTACEPPAVQLGAGVLSARLFSPLRKTSSLRLAPALGIGPDLAGPPAASFVAPTVRPRQRSLADEIASADLDHVERHLRRGGSRAGAGAALGR